MTKLFEAIKTNGGIDEDIYCPWYDADCKHCPYVSENTDSMGRKCVEAFTKDLNSFLFEAMEPISV